MIKLYTNVLKV